MIEPALCYTHLAGLFMSCGREALFTAGYMGLGPVAASMLAR